METKKVNADINPVWHNSFSIHNIALEDIIVLQ